MTYRYSVVDGCAALEVTIIKVSDIARRVGCRRLKDGRTLAAYKRKKGKKEKRKKRKEKKEGPKRIP